MTPGWANGISRRPHARGGGPHLHNATEALRQSSPRAWGWTATSRWRARPSRVVPTRVGVDRVSAHTLMRWAASSPRAWGWTVSGSQRGCRRCVVPTRVGVDRLPDAQAPEKNSRPHARGGGPSAGVSAGAAGASSPRAWGWTGGRARAGHLERVVPTRVGVDRQHRTPPTRARCRPHARGGGPNPVYNAEVAAKSSPRAWGWTDVRLRGW